MNAGMDKWSLATCKTEKCCCRSRISSALQWDSVLKKEPQQYTQQALSRAKHHQRDRFSERTCYEFVSTVGFSFPWYGPDHLHAILCEATNRHHALVHFWSINGRNVLFVGDFGRRLQVIKSCALFCALFWDACCRNDVVTGNELGWM